MKNKIKILLSIFIFLGFVSCDSELEELYQNPDAFSKEQADKEESISVLGGYFSSQCSQGGFLRGDYGAQYHFMGSGTKLLGTGVGIPYVTSDYGLDYTLRDVESGWAAPAFNNGMYNAIKGRLTKNVVWGQYEYNQISEDKVTNLDKLFLNLLYLLKGYAYQKAIDYYDLVPYVETGSAGAFDGDKAQIKGQAYIYPKLIEELATISKVLNELELTEGQKVSFKNQDLIFDGKIEDWVKFSNSLRLKCAISVSEQMPELTRTTIADLADKPMLDESDDVVGISDLAIIEPYRIGSEVGITRGIRENGWLCRAPQKFIQDVMNCQPEEKTFTFNGEQYKAIVGDNSEEGLRNGTVDPRIAYMFAKDILGRYVGVITGYDKNKETNSLYNMSMRGYYYNDSVLIDNAKKYILVGMKNEAGKFIEPDTIKLNDSAINNMNYREEFLLNKLRVIVGKNQDTDWDLGTDKLMVSEYNVRPFHNFNMRYPTMHSTEIELLLAEAAVRGFGTIKGSARDHYKKAIELSCEYWYDLNANHTFTKQTVPGFPSSVVESRVTSDKPTQKYEASTYAENAAVKFDAMSKQQKLQAIFNQLHVHYNFLNFEVPFAAARRMVKSVGTNPAGTYETYKFKERMTYPNDIQGSDPDSWIILNANNNPDIPLWFTGRTEKWKNVLE